MKRLPRSLTVTPTTLRAPANGNAIPVLGFGTFGMVRADMLRMIPAALAGGFRHIDTAQIYGNEEEVGECVQASGIPRSQLFLTTKVWPANYHEPAFTQSVDASLRRLRTDYVDLLLLHWPGGSNVPLDEQLGSLNAAAAAGKARYIGVSNFNSRLMSEAARLSKVPIATNQFEYHPFLNQAPLVRATRQLGIAATAYCAMAVGRVFGNDDLKRIARERNRSVSQIVLRWLVQQEGVFALSRTTNPARVKENLAVFDFELSAEEMSVIFALARHDGRIVQPLGLSPAWDVTPADPVRA
jgi:2,5-diketo-D-gluconate reductase B